MEPNAAATQISGVEELKSILKRSEQDPSLLTSIQQENLRQRNRPHAYFSFPGTRNSMMSLPPFQKWPIQLGWSFSTWVFLEPKACAQPYLYNFKTGKSGLGYSAHFTGNCLVLSSIRVKGKGLQHCVAYEFPSQKWIHCAVTYHNKWRASEIKVYVNGQLTANIDMPWQVQTNEIFDKCFIGGSGSITKNDLAGDLNCFSGQLAAIYLFNEGLSAAQICALHRLGPSYMGQFKYSNESHVNLPPQICKTLYEEKLVSTLFCLFTPVAVDSGTLCIQLAPFRSSTSASAQNYFISAPHAALQGETKAVISQPICSILQSLGCSRSLLPLLEVYCERGDSEACTALIGFLCDLLESSPHWFANEIVQNNGFVIVACALTNNARILLTEKLLDTFLNLTRILLTSASSPGDSLLLKHILDNILLNPALWVYAESSVQIKLYSYLANEFLHGTRHGSNKYAVSNTTATSSLPYLAYSPTSHGGLAAYDNATNSGASGNTEQPKSGSFEAPSIVADLLFGEIRRVSTVLQLLHALKYYYWASEETSINQKARNIKLRPEKSELLQIRSHILRFLMELIGRANTSPLDEIQGILNYLSSCSQSENILDVIDTLSNLILEQSTTVVIALDQKQAVRVLYTLIGSSDEEVCIRAIRLLTLFLSHCSYKKKQDIMGPSNLFMLLCDRLRGHLPLSLRVYEALIDLMIEENNPDRCIDDKRPIELSKKTIVNSTVIKVIATLIHEQRTRPRVKKISHSSNSGHQQMKSLDIRAFFINDLWNLIVNSRDNRRIILQMSVWQHWLINLIDSTLDDSPLTKDQVLAIFRVLLYHAVRYEFGGWRVWIDTLAIIHAKVSHDEFCHQLSKESSPNNSIGREHAPNRINAKCHEVASEGKHTEVTNPSPESSKSTSKAEEKEESDNAESKRLPVCVSSISEHILNESRGIEITEDEDQKSEEQEIEEHDKKDKGVDEPDSVETAKADGDETKHDQDEGIATDKEISLDTKDDKVSMDSIDLAPSRSYRRTSLHTDELGGETSPTSNANEQSAGSSQTAPRQQSLSPVPLDEPTPSAHESNTEQENEQEVAPEKQEINELGDNSVTCDESRSTSRTNHHKATASPAFRIPEFKWTNVLIKLLNDLIFSIECDLYHWRYIAKLDSLDTPPFVPRAANSATGQASSSNISGQSTTAAGNSTSTNASIDSILHKPENQIYIINVIHFVSQLADNAIIAAGGLLPLLAEATGGSRGSSASPNSSDPLKVSTTCEGLTMAQANSLLYRLINMVDMVVFAASHINLSELESDKNTTSGGLLRQCLRLACTVTVKNCLVLRSVSHKFAALGIGVGDIVPSTIEIPKDMFDSYLGCSLLSANSLFDQSALTLENSDLIANLEYSPHQNPNTSSAPSILPFQTSPIKDPNKLLQTIDIQRIQACIYHTGSTESRQSQFLALSSLYFISVLMVSRYRDIIEPKQRSSSKYSKSNSSAASSSSRGDSSPVTGESSQKQANANPLATTSGTEAISSVEANLLNFGKMQPNSQGQSSSVPVTTSTITNMLTSKLENTLDTVCPLLKTIMCDFCSFLSKTLIGSHGQDLVNKEADRTFRRANASPVEVVMLLCSQEWQNTLQKNAGLAFIELINEGRVLSHGSKDHIVRVAMEAEFILSRLRADDVHKHEQFGLVCSETLSARLHEEVLINSLISSAARRDFVLYCKFKEVLKNEGRQTYKLDIWEDDDRRKRRFVFDSWDDAMQIFYLDKSNEDDAKSGDKNSTSDKESSQTEAEKTNTKRILDLQKTIEMGGINDHCSPSGASAIDASRARNVTDDESDIENYEDENEDDEDREPTSQHSSENDNNKRGSVSDRINARGDHSQNNVYNQTGDELADITNNNHVRVGAQRHIGNSDVDAADESDMKAASDNIWDYDECGSMNDFSGSVVFAAEASLVWAIYAIPGIVQISTHEIHFEPNQNITEAIDALQRESSADQNGGAPNDGTEETSVRSLRLNQNEAVGGTAAEQVALRKIDLKALRYCDFLTCNGKILLSDIRAIFSRHYLLQPNALEIFVSQRTSVMFAFADFDIVRRVVKYLPPVGVGIKYGIPQSRRASLMSPRQLFTASNMTQRWQKREIGNFQYLMFLNTISGRTFQDMNQYPVFPWILTDYESEELDLNLPKNFRDLSKPIGALNNKRRAEFVERYQSWDNPKVPAFHYGTHYSTAAFTLNWLCRLRGAYNSSYLALQDGKYEESSRLFLSIGDSWVSSLSGGHQNVKELIPEFFYLPEIFHSNLGLPEVEYPPWAKTAEQFVRMHRIALESELVSCQLHQWIDLIFGYKQRGPEAVNAINTFYYLTYQGNVNLNMIQEPSLREAIETQIKHFGQTPSQLSTEPHPPRFSALHASPLMYSSRQDEINKVVKFPFNNPVVHISSCIHNYIVTGSSAASASVGDSSNSLGTIQGSNSDTSPSSVLTITSNNQYQIHKWMPSDQSGHPITLDPQLEGQTASGGASNSGARRQLIDVDDMCSDILLKLKSNQDQATAQSKTEPQGDQGQQDIVDEVQWPCAHYIVTLNGKYIIMGSFYDNSFRVFTTESGKLCQVIYGHRGPITCIARSEGNALADFYIATGGQDCSLLLWNWNERFAQVEGSGVSAVHNPLPKLSICGHQSPVLSAMICSELGLVASGSKNLVLVHNITSGENLLHININLPEIMDRTLSEHKLLHKQSSSGSQQIKLRPQVQNKEKTILEASMLGEQTNGNENSNTGSVAPVRIESDTTDGEKQLSSSEIVAKADPGTTNNQSPSCSMEEVKDEQLLQLKDLCRSDYYITNLQLARELAFIVCVALPPPLSRKKSKSSSSEFNSRGQSPALLITFNLKGSLMDSQPIGQASASSSPKLGDVCALQLSRDGEHLILNDSPITIKIYKTFGLQPLYAYNTNDLPEAPLSVDQNRIKSLALLDHKYILVGLENGKLIVYNCDFKNLN